MVRWKHRLSSFKLPISSAFLGQFSWSSVPLETETVDIYCLLCRLFTCPHCLVAVHLLRQRISMQKTCCLLYPYWLVIRSSFFVFFFFFVTKVTSVRVTRNCCLHFIKRIGSGNTMGICFWFVSVSTWGWVFCFAFAFNWSRVSTVCEDLWKFWINGLTSALKFCEK